MNMAVNNVTAQTAGFPGGDSAQSHVVQRGDTLSAIAQQNGVSLSQLLAANPQINNPNLIYPGQHITIPGGGTGGGSAAVETGATTGAGQGSAGGVTPEQLQQIVPGLSAQKAAEVAPHLNSAMAEANINTPQRQAMFIAQLAHESGGFRYMEEIASGAAYEGRADLGNTQPGDGVRFKGRGYIQVTGRHNYTEAGKALGLDLVNNPQLAAQPENAARIAAWYWNSRNINAAADAGDFTKVTRLINGGTNGLADRQAYYARAQQAIGSGNGGNAPQAPVDTPPSAPGGSPPSGAGRSHTVRSGDTLSAIAAANGVSLSSLIQANPQISNPNLIYPGQTVNLPGGGSDAAAGGTHTVRSGDTLSAIAAANGVSLSSLIQANPQISNPNLIYPGQTINIPGGGNGGGRVDGPGGATGPAPVEGADGARPTGGNPAAIAERYLGWNAGDLKVSGELPMESWVPNNVNCANFVTAVLQESGAINWHSNRVVDTRDGLLRDGWTRVGDISQARPGDVVIMDRNGQSHVVFFHSFDANGQPRFIGSNNVNADGSQRISWGGASGSYYLLTPPR